MTKIITVAAMKGGVGKTTTALALAQFAATCSKRVLCVDLDPQRNLSDALKANPELAGTFELLEYDLAVEQVIQQCGNIDLIAGSADLAAIKSKAGSGIKLRDALQKAGDAYDLVVIDTPPAIGELVTQALMASTEVLIPVYADIHARRAVLQIVGIAKQIAAGNPLLKATGVIVTNAAKRKIQTMIEDDLKSLCDELSIPFLGSVRGCIAVQEAQAVRANLFIRSPKSTAATDYASIFGSMI